MQDLSQNPTMPQLCMVGLGYIGLPTAVVFASRAVPVVGLDISETAVHAVNNGKTHIFEPGLEEGVRQVVHAGHLRATTIPEPADAFLIAVPTPFRQDGHMRVPDMSYVQAAARSIAPVLKRGDLVILESTSPVGATELMAGWLAEERPDLTFPQTHGEVSDIRIAHCPERILPGYALQELVSNDRIIGGMTPVCAQRAYNIYKMAVEGDCVLTDCRTAELCKLTENSFRDVNIAFANEMSLVCDKLGVNVWELIRLANLHPRVNILQPGPGVGGHCIAVDPWFIVAQAPHEARIIRTAREVNDAKPHWVLDKIRAAVSAAEKNNARPARIACLGLTFKPDIDDLRESPALGIVQALVADYPGQVCVVEPHIATLPDDLQGHADLVNVEQAIATADVCTLLVDHAEFKAMRAPRRDGLTLIDTRGIWRT